MHLHHKRGLSSTQAESIIGSLAQKGPALSRKAGQIGILSLYLPGGGTRQARIVIGQRNASPVGELVYSTIRQAAKNAWWLLHAEDYEGATMQGRVRDYLGATEET